MLLENLYTDERIRVLGELPLEVQHHGQRKQLVRLVLEGDGPNLLGRNRLEQLNLDRIIPAEGCYVCDQARLRARARPFGIIPKAAPIVSVTKKDGTFPICSDYKVTVNEDKKVTVNQALEVDQYPLPQPEHLFATLAGGKKFTELDLSQAYQQLRLDKDSVQRATINTHKILWVHVRKQLSRQGRGRRK